MAFFTNELANTMQYISFPLEVTGLILATIEVRFPQTAQLITASFSREWKEIADKVEEDLQILGPDSGAGVLKVVFSKWYRWSFQHPVLSVAACFLMSFLVTVFGTYVTLQLLEIENIEYWPVMVSILNGLSVTYGVSFAVLGIPLLTFWISMRWVKGREIGTLGLIIAGFGVLAEAYQFTTQLVV